MDIQLPPLDLRRQAFNALSDPLQHKWTVQGFGMLRTYLDPDKRYRLNIWHAALAVPGVSIIHDHPWHFRSWILAGAFVNQRYTVRTSEEWRHDQEPTHHGQVILTGEGGGPKGLRFDAQLVPGPLEIYSVGETYKQQRDEVHASFYQDGTCTLNDRTERVGEDARVFWPYGQEWVDAEPREATASEVGLATASVQSRVGAPFVMFNPKA